MENSSAPESIINKISSQGKIFRYPSNISDIRDSLHHFMMIKEYRYKEERKSEDPLMNAQTKFENLTSTTDYYDLMRSFCLPLPQGGISTAYSADYGPADVGFFGKVIENEASEITDNIQKYFSEYQKSSDFWLSKTADFYMNVGKDMYDVGKKVTSSFSESDVANRIKMNVATYAGSFASLMSNARGEDIASLSMRAQRNPYTSLVFSGIKNKRTHDFSFQFSPRKSTESNDLVKLIANLKLGMLPSLPKLKPQVLTTMVEDPKFSQVSTSKYQVPEQARKIPKTTKIENNMDSLLFNYPNVYTIDFYDVNNNDPYINKYLFRIGQSVLTSLKVKYSDTFFEDTGLPTQIDLSLSFKENFALSRSHVEKGY